MKSTNYEAPQYVVFSSFRAIARVFGVLGESSALPSLLHQLTSKNEYSALVCTMLQCSFILEFNHNVVTDHVNM
jgi:hypothetical protein